jgi:hypothetical protein
MIRRDVSFVWAGLWRSEERSGESLRRRRQVGKHETGVNLDEVFGPVSIGLEDRNEIFRSVVTGCSELERVTALRFLLQTRCRVV